MIRHFIASVVRAAAMFAIVLLLSSFVAAQSTQVNASTAKALDVPRTPDGKPDISGVWTGPGFRHIEGARNPDVPTVGLTRFKSKDLPFRPGGEELWNNKLNGDAFHDDPTLLCFPWGFPFHTMVSNVQHFFQPTGYLVIVYEDMHVTRTIPMDGRPHPQNLKPTYYGNSVGRYEGDTAVIDTIGLKEWGIDGSGNHKHSDAAHFIERYRRTGPTTMSQELTIDDPKIFTEPFTCGTASSHCFPEGNRGPELWVKHLRSDWEVIEQYCEDNNKDVGLIEFLKHKK
jgi:hypothetical protein